MQDIFQNWWNVQREQLLFSISLDICINSNNILPFDEYESEPTDRRQIELSRRFMLSSDNHSDMRSILHAFNNKTQTSAGEGSSKFKHIALQTHSSLFSNTFINTNSLLPISNISLNTMTPPLLLRPHAHPRNPRRPNDQRNRTSNHRPRPPRKFGCVICRVENYRPPCVYGAGACVHGGNDDGAEGVFFVAEGVVCPSEKGRLACGTMC